MSTETVIEMSTNLDPSHFERFATAGNAIFTVESSRTGARFTYRVRARASIGNGVLFVSVLTGSDNENDYSYIGWIDQWHGFRHGGAKSSIGSDASSVIAFAWLWRHRSNPSPARVYHEGRCGRCGRRLTVPSSIESGLGPECLEKSA